MDKTKEEKFTVLAVPRNRGYVIKSEMSEEFKNSTNSKKDNEQISKMAEAFRLNNLTQIVVPKKRVRRKR